MKATIDLSTVCKPEGHIGVCYMVELSGDGRGLFCTADKDEAEELARRVNEYQSLKAEFEKTKASATRLRKKLKATEDALIAARPARDTAEG